MTVSWVTGALSLTGMDNRIMALLAAIAQTGSITQAAKHCGLSYKGAWQMIERANNSAPKMLVNTAKGGSKGGGTCLTPTGTALLALFNRLQRQHQAFLQQLNQQLASTPETRLLLQHLAVKTSMNNQAFGTITQITHGAVHAQVSVQLSDNTNIIVNLGESTLALLNIQLGCDALVLIERNDLLLVSASDNRDYCALNTLFCTVLASRADAFDTEVSVLLRSGELFNVVVNTDTAEPKSWPAGTQAKLLFTANASILGVGMGGCL